MPFSTITRTNACSFPHISMIKYSTTINALAGKGKHGGWISLDSTPLNRDMQEESDYLHIYRLGWEQIDTTTMKWL